MVTTTTAAAETRQSYKPARKREVKTKKTMAKPAAKPCDPSTASGAGRVGMPGGLYALPLPKQGKMVTHNHVPSGPSNVK